MAVSVVTRSPVSVEPETFRPTVEAIVQATAVDKIYDTGKLQVQALRAVSFAVNRGEMVAIMGPSGSGKTTLLNCLSGLDRIDAGEVAIEGVPLNAMSDEERTDYRAKRMGFVFQFYNLMPVLTSVENVELPLLVARVPAKDARRKALEALDLVGLRDRATHVPDELSGGQRQRVTIARALVNNPAIVWADEPTGDLDSENAEEIVELMRRLNVEHGLTFLIVTHDIGVGRATDRIVRMVDARSWTRNYWEVDGDGCASHACGDRRCSDERRRRYQALRSDGHARARAAGRLRRLLRPDDAAWKGARADVLAR
jgi:ABC-type lipoprotein export system ATPase subunit